MSKKSNKNYKFTNISNFFVQLKKIGANRCFNFLSIPMRAPFFKSRTISRLNAFNLKGRFLWILLVIWWNLTALVVVGFKTKSTESSLSNKWPLKTTSISYFKREMGKKFSKKRLYFLRHSFYLPHWLMTVRNVHHWQDATRYCLGIYHDHSYRDREKEK